MTDFDRKVSNYVWNGMGRKSGSTLAMAVAPLAYMGTATATAYGHAGVGLVQSVVETTARNNNKTVNKIKCL